MSMPAITIKRFGTTERQEPPGVSAKPMRTLSQLPVPDELITRPPPSRDVARPMTAKDPPVLIVNYPRSGKRVLPVGTTTIDVKQCNVRLPDNTIEEMYTTRKVDSCRCFALYTDKMIDVRVSRHGALIITSSVFPAWIRKLDMPEFDMIEIECAEPTTFYIVMSEVPEGVPEHHPERWLSPPSSLGYNAADDLVAMRKVIDGVTINRSIDDPDVADKVVTKWVEFGTWEAI